ncbi:MAG: carbohydrate-binding protein [Lachnospiraceae bacterium]
MGQYRITVWDEQKNRKQERMEENSVIFPWKGSYTEGDIIEFEVPSVPGYYVIKVDDCIEEALVYLTKQSFEHVVPFGERKNGLNPKSFSGEVHYLTLRPAKEWEYKAYRNLSQNTLDQANREGCFPHVQANVETRGDSAFAACNVIDGVIGNELHGKWPYQSWGISQREDAEVTIVFGRSVRVEEVLIFLRADFPHDSWWERATLEFSDGSEEVVSLEKTKDGQVFNFAKSNITWVKMKEMKRADDPSPFPSLTQLQVFGSIE